MADPEVSPDVAVRFARAVQAVAEASHGLSERFSHDQGLALTDVRALTVLAMAGEPMPAGELARRVALTSSAATRLVDRLEASGHARRVEDPTDRRRVLVAHTAAATAVAEDWFRPLAVRLSQRLEPLSADQARIVVEVVEGIAADLRAAGPRATRG